MWMASSRPCLVSMLLEVSGPLLKSVVTCAKQDGYHFCMHGFPSFEWLAVQIWIFRRNSSKRTKSTSYWKHCYNCPKMVHVGLHSVGTYHKKFGCQNLKNKNILCWVSRLGHSTKKPLPSASHVALDIVFLKTLSPLFVECLSVGTRQRRLCWVSDPRHSAKPILDF
jgi:hypothetical protein